MSDWAEIDNALLDPQWYAADDHHEAFRRLRDEDPVHWTQDDRFGKHYWTLTRYDDVKNYLLDHHSFSSRWHTHVPRSPKRMTPEERHAQYLDVAIALNDNPVHDLYRRPVNKHFSMPAISKMQEHISASIDKVLDQAAEQGHCDVVEDLALGVPTNVVFTWLGVPQEDWPELHEAVWQYSAAADPRFTIDGDEILTANTGQRRILEYCEGLAKARLKQPQDDFMTVIVNLEIDGEKMSMHEIISWFFFLISGALETTRNTISSGFWLLLNHPEQREKLVGDPALVKGAVEEILRWASPSRNRLRIASRDVEFGGRDIHAGDWVVAFLTSANRDERVFDDPHIFDITRTPNRHLALGEGIHLCLGRNLARLEVGTVLSKFFTRFDNVELSGSAVKLPDALGNGFASLPVSFSPRESVVAR
jgi:cholest-4-en-3-one 26-monooxygenase